MPRGGARQGAGRKAGVRNRATTALAAEIAASGELPRDYMLRIMRDVTVDAARRDAMAKAVAPYVHPHLANVEHTGKDGDAIQTVTRIEIVPADVNRSG